MNRYILAISVKNEKRFANACDTFKAFSLLGMLTGFLLLGGYIEHLIG